MKVKVRRYREVKSVAHCSSTIRGYTTRCLLGAGANLVRQARTSTPTITPSSSMYFSGRGERMTTEASIAQATWSVLQPNPDCIAEAEASQTLARALQLASKGIANPLASAILKKGNLDLEETASTVAKALMNRGRLELIVLQNAAAAEAFACCSAVLEMTSEAQLFTSLILAVAVAAEPKEVIPMGPISIATSASAEELYAAGGALSRFVETASVANGPRRKLATSKPTQDGEKETISVISKGLPRRVLIGHLTCTMRGATNQREASCSSTSSTSSVILDVAIERDHHGARGSGDMGSFVASSSKGTWSTPGFRVLLTKDRKTIAYVLVEVHRSAVPGSFSAGYSTFEWSLKGMKVDDSMRGRGLSKSCLALWLLLCFKVGGSEMVAHVSIRHVSLLTSPCTPASTVQGWGDSNYAADPQTPHLARPPSLWL